MVDPVCPTCFELASPPERSRGKKLHIWLSSSRNFWVKLSLIRFKLQTAMFCEQSKQGCVFTQPNLRLHHSPRVCRCWSTSPRRSSPFRSGSRCGGRGSRPRRRTGSTPTATRTLGSCRTSLQRSNLPSTPRWRREPSYPEAPRLQEYPRKASQPANWSLYS